MRFVLYGFGAVTFALMTVRAGDVMESSGRGGSLAALTDALFGYVIPLGSFAAGVALGELRRLRVGLERLTGDPDPAPGGPAAQVSPLLSAVEQVRAAVSHPPGSPGA